MDRLFFYAVGSEGNKFQSYLHVHVHIMTHMAWNRLGHTKRKKGERTMTEHDFTLRHGDPHQDVDDLIFTDQADWCVSER